MRRSRLALLALVVVLGGALFVGARGDGDPPTPARRAGRLASKVRCPTCDGLSAAESDAPSSQAVRQEIRERIDAGISDGDILNYLVSRYPGILLTPPASGVGALVWVLPPMALVVAGAALAAAFRRWRSIPAGTVTDEDRALVARALER
ncbi:MAG: cytochrome c-type biogenesis protein [Acidimicrobiales bacterium]